MKYDQEEAERHLHNLDNALAYFVAVGLMTGTELMETVVRGSMKNPTPLGRAGMEIKKRGKEKKP